MKKLIYILIALLTYNVHADVSGRTFVAFDVETTGFSPEEERVIEIGAVKYCDGEIVDSTHWLINPGCPILNSEVHGISDEMIIGYPGFNDTYRAFSNFVGNAVLLAHNASFDVRFMTAEIERNGLKPLPNPTINTLTLFRRWFPDAPSHKLGPLAEYLKIPVAVEHRAEDDSATLLKIFNLGLETRPSITLGEITAAANGTYYLNGTRKP
ncbi:3'-5' exonuclease [Pontiellaceae bacterium B1224]|nr:3'-5' exonuclease [Pontiellaceae bacterium B1224]